MRNNQHLHSLYLFLQAVDSFSSFHPISAFHGKRKKEFGRKHLQQKPLTTTTTHVSDVECQIDCFACFAAYFSSFPKENAFQNLEENL